VLFLFAFVGYVIHWFGGIAVQFDPIDYARGVFIQIKHDSLTVFPFFSDIKYSFLAYAC